MKPTLETRDILGSPKRREDLKRPPTIQFQRRRRFFFSVALRVKEEADGLPLVTSPGRMAAVLPFSLRNLRK